MDEVKVLLQRAEEISNEQIADTRALAMKNAFKEFIKQIKIVGPLLSARDAYNSTFEQENLRIALDRLNENLEELERQQKIDHTYLCDMQKEVYFIYKAFANSILYQADSEYIDYLSKYVTNCINIDFTEERMKLSILNKITKYTSLHFNILRQIYCDSVTRPESDQREYRLLNNRSDVDFCISELQYDGFIREDKISGIPITANPVMRHTSTGEFLLRMLELDCIN